MPKKIHNSKTITRLTQITELTENNEAILVRSRRLYDTRPGNEAYSAVPVPRPERAQKTTLVAQRASP